MNTLKTTRPAKVFVPVEKQFKKYGKIIHIADADDKEIIKAAEKMWNHVIPTNYSKMIHAETVLCNMLTELERRGIEIELEPVHTKAQAYTNESLHYLKAKLNLLPKDKLEKLLEMVK